MDREGQTWCATQRSVTFLVVSSREDEEGFWIHDVLFLENRSAPELTGTRGKLMESMAHDFDKLLFRVQ